MDFTKRKASYASILHVCAGISVYGDKITFMQLAFDQRKRKKKEKIDLSYHGLATGLSKYFSDMLKKNVEYFFPFFSVFLV